MFSTLFINIYFLFICFFVVPVFFTDCVSLFVNEGVLWSLLLHNLTFSCPRSQDDVLVTDCITHKIKVYAYNNNKFILSKYAAQKESLRSTNVLVML